MKNIALLIFIVLIAIVGCKNQEKEVLEVSSETIETPMETNHPAAVTAIFEAHGGLAHWNAMNNLCFEMEGKAGPEVQTVSLKDRRTKIQTADWSIGYDGNDVWLLQNTPESYKGNARFYHNLMFYFYAMPFVLADDGIVYTEMPDTELDGKNYKAVNISFNDGVGDAPKDEYVLYFDPEKNTMEWLGYTVTFGETEKSKDFHYIKYDQWQDVNGLQLPSKLIWYNIEDGKPTTARNERLFTKVTATETIIEASVFKKPEAATVVPL